MASSKPNNASSKPTTTTFGATIVPTPSRNPNTTAPSTTTATTTKNPGLQVLETPNLTPTPSHEDLTATTTITSTLAHPAYSPFYEHDRPPLDRAASSFTLSSPAGARSVLNEKDLEAGVAGVSTTLLSIPRDPESPFSNRISLQRTSPTHGGGSGGPGGEGKEDGMWPSKQTLLRGRQAEKKRRRDRKFCGGCTGPVVEFWGKRSKGQRLGIKLGIAVLVLGLAVTIGLCISIAVHGGVYAGKGREEGIDVPGQR